MNAEKQKAGGNGQPTGADASTPAIISQVSANARTRPLADDISLIIGQFKRQCQAEEKEQADKSTSPPDLFALARMIRRKYPDSLPPPSSLTSGISVWMKRHGYKGDPDELATALADILKNTKKAFDFEAFAARYNAHCPPLPSLLPFWPLAGHEALHRLGWLCAELQQWHGVRPFFLSTRKAAQVLNLTPQSVSVLMRRLIQTGLLRVIKPHTTTQARRFQWLVLTD